MFSHFKCTGKCQNISTPRCVCCGLTFSLTSSMLCSRPWNTNNWQNISHCTKRSRVFSIPRATRWLDSFSGRIWAGAKASEVLGCLADLRLLEILVRQKWGHCVGNSFGQWLWGGVLLVGCTPEVADPHLGALYRSVLRIFTTFWWHSPFLRSKLIWICFDLYLTPTIMPIMM